MEKKNQSQKIERVLHHFRVFNNLHKKTLLEKEIRQIMDELHPNNCSYQQDKSVEVNSELSYLGNKLYKAMFDKLDERPPYLFSELDIKKLINLFTA
jgi:hypothetical protein